MVLLKQQIICVVAVTFGILTSSIEAVPTHQVIPYQRSWVVSDPATNNYQNWIEMKLPNGDVFGSYSVLLPNYEIHTTTYNVTGGMGYRATRSIIKIDPAMLL